LLTAIAIATILVSEDHVLAEHFKAQLQHVKIIFVLLGADRLLQDYQLAFVGNFSTRSSGAGGGECRDISAWAKLQRLIVSLGVLRYAASNVQLRPMLPSTALLGADRR